MGLCSSAESTAGPIETTKSDSRPKHAKPEPDIPAEAPAQTTQAQVQPSTVQPSTEVTSKSESIDQPEEPLRVFVNDADSPGSSEAPVAVASADNTQASLVVSNSSGVGTANSSSAHMGDDDYGDGVDPEDDEEEEEEEEEDEEEEEEENGTAGEQRGLDGDREASKPKRASKRRTKARMRRKSTGTSFQAEEEEVERLKRQRELEQRRESRLAKSGGSVFDRLTNTQPTGKSGGKKIASRKTTERGMHSKSNSDGMARDRDKKVKPYSATGNVFDRLTDQSSFTGMYKARHDGEEDSEDAAARDASMRVPSLRNLLRPELKDKQGDGRKWVTTPRVEEKQAAEDEERRRQKKKEHYKAKGNVFDRLTSSKSFTGIHKARADGAIDRDEELVTAGAAEARFTSMLRGEVKEDTTERKTRRRKKRLDREEEDYDDDEDDEAEQEQERQKLEEEALQKELEAEQQRQAAEEEALARAAAAEAERWRNLPAGSFDLPRALQLVYRQLPASFEIMGSDGPVDRNAFVLNLKAEWSVLDPTNTGRMVVHNSRVPAASTDEDGVTEHSHLSEVKEEDEDEDEAEAEAKKAERNDDVITFWDHVNLAVVSDMFVGDNPRNPGYFAAPSETQVRNCKLDELFLRGLNEEFNTEAAADAFVQKLGDSFPASVDSADFVDKLVMQWNLMDTEQFGMLTVGKLHRFVWRAQGHGADEYPLPSNEDLPADVADEVAGLLGKNESELKFSDFAQMLLHLEAQNTKERQLQAEAYPDMRMGTEEFDFEDEVMYSDDEENDNAEDQEEDERAVTFLPTVEEADEDPSEAKEPRTKSSGSLRQRGMGTPSGSRGRQRKSAPSTPTRPRGGKKPKRQRVQKTPTRGSDAGAARAKFLALRFAELQGMRGFTLATAVKYVMYQLDLLKTELVKMGEEHRAADWPPLDLDRVQEQWTALDRNMSGMVTLAGLRRFVWTAAQDDEDADAAADMPAVLPQELQEYVDNVMKGAGGQEKGYFTFYDFVNMELADKGFGIPSLWQWQNAQVAASGDEQKIGSSDTLFFFDLDGCMSFLSSRVPARMADPEHGKMVLQKLREQWTQLDDANPPRGVVSKEQVLVFIWSSMGLDGTVQDAAQSEDGIPAEVLEIAAEIMTGGALEEPELSSLPKQLGFWDFANILLSAEGIDIGTMQQKE